MSFNELNIMILVLGEIRYNINPSVLIQGFWYSFFTSMIGTIFYSTCCLHVSCLMPFSEWKEHSSNLSPLVLCSLPSPLCRCVDSRSAINKPVSNSRPTCLPRIPVLSNCGHDLTTFLFKFDLVIIHCCVFCS